MRMVGGIGEQCRFQSTSQYPSEKDIDSQPGTGVAGLWHDNAVGTAIDRFEAAVRRRKVNAGDPGAPRSRVYL